MLQRLALHCVRRTEVPRPKAGAGFCIQVRQLQMEDTGKVKADESCENTATNLWW